MSVCFLVTWYICSSCNVEGRILHLYRWLIFTRTYTIGFVLNTGQLLCIEEQWMYLTECAFIYKIHLIRIMIASFWSSFYCWSSLPVHYLTHQSSNTSLFLGQITDPKWSTSLLTVSNIIVYCVQKLIYLYNFVYAKYWKVLIYVWKNLVKNYKTENIFCFNHYCHVRKRCVVVFYWNFPLLYSLYKLDTQILGVVFGGKPMYSIYPTHPLSNRVFLLNVYFNFQNIFYRKDGFASWWTISAFSRSGFHCWSPLLVCHHTPNLQHYLLYLLIYFWSNSVNNKLCYIMISTSY